MSIIRYSETAEFFKTPLSFYRRFPDKPSNVDDFFKLNNELEKTTVKNVYEANKLFDLWRYMNREFEGPNECNMDFIELIRKEYISWWISIHGFRDNSDSDTATTGDSEESSDSEDSSEEREWILEYN